MNDYRQRIEAIGLLPVFEAARHRGDKDAMKRLLEDANFAPLEIESILWSKGNIGPAPTEEDKRRKYWDAVIGRVGIALISGLFLGGVFVYFSSGLASAEASGEDPGDVVMRDYRSPREAYYRPFLWGFAIGTAAGLATGRLLVDPTAKIARAIEEKIRRHNA
jgi:hypothetical protein